MTFDEIEKKIWNTIVNFQDNSLNYSIFFVYLNMNNYYVIQKNIKANRCYSKAFGFIGEICYYTSYGKYILKLHPYLTNEDILIETKEIDMAKMKHNVEFNNKIEKLLD